MKCLRKNERGIVLVAVLLAVAVLFVVASIVSAQSLLISRQSLNDQFKMTQIYDNESLQSEIIYKAYIDEDYRKSTQALDEEEGFDPFIPDAQERYQENEDSKIYYKIKDAMTGYPLWDSSQRLLVGQLQDQLALESETQSEALALHFEKIKDYQDFDEIPLANGGDEGDLYDNPLLPRNGPIQFIEELLFVPQELAEENIYKSLGLNLAYPGQIDEVIQLPTSVGRSNKLRSRFRRPSFLSSSSEAIAQKLQLTEGELQTVVEAKEAWFKERLSFQQSLGDQLYNLIKKDYDFTISTVYTIVQEARNRDDLSPIILKTTVDITRILNLRDADVGYIHYMRNLIY